MSELAGSYDVLVAGGGNAALCAAIAAREAGASVLLVEHAPRAFRGGNSRHTRNFRVMHAAPTATLTEAYAEDEYWDDLRRVTGGETDEALARLTIRNSGPALTWMESRGVRFQPSLTGTLGLSRTNAFFLGGGKALLNAYYRTAERLGVVVAYEAEVQDVRLRDGAVESVVIESGGRTMRPRVKTVIVAAGGFQANIDWLRQYWG
ncbi:MAG: FAD-dependent oxidoreductase, partial [Stellaceae bacterium]